MEKEESHHGGISLQAIARGEEKAFKQLFDTYRDKLYSYLYKITQSAELAEDGIQEVFLKIWAKRRDLPGIDNLNAYIHRMAHNHAYDGFRRMAKETLLLKEINRATDTEPEERLASKEVTQYLQETINKLTPQQKLVFVLSREAGLKQSEIAKRLNISIHTVKKHMVDALQVIRSEMSKRFGSYATAIFVIYQLF